MEGRGQLLQVGQVMDHHGLPKGVRCSLDTLGAILDRISKRQDFHFPGTVSLDIFRNMPHRLWVVRGGFSPCPCSFGFVKQDPP